MAIAARMPMMATTIISSMSVKPPRLWFRVFTLVSPLVLFDRLKRHVPPRTSARRFDAQIPVRTSPGATSVPGDPSWVPGSATRAANLSPRRGDSAPRDGGRGGLSTAPE
jgi:hypothetical protein